MVKKYYEKCNEKDIKKKVKRLEKNIKILLRKKKINHKKKLENDIKILLKKKKEKGITVN